jgi:hypothetical protein
LSNRTFGQEKYKYSIHSKLSYKFWNVWTAAHYEWCYVDDIKTILVLDKWYRLTCTIISNHVHVGLFTCPAPTEVQMFAFENRTETVHRDYVMLSTNCSFVICMWNISLLQRAPRAMLCALDRFTRTYVTIPMNWWS